MKSISCINCKEKSSATCILEPDELETLNNKCVEVEFKKGDTIFRQGTLSADIKYLKTGLVKIHMTGPSKEKILHLAKAPSYMGIPTTFANKINQYSATAIEDSTVCFIPSETFKNFIIKNGKFAYEIILDLCMNDLEDYHRYVDQYQKQVPGRLASTLLCLANKIYMKDSFELPLSRTELADLTGTSRESICRVLSDLNNDKIIHIHGKEITILKEDLLIEISEKG